ncbi:hypothetical protein ACJ41O_006696 [Fusarium nematophilum]
MEIDWGMAAVATTLAIFVARVGWEAMNKTTTMILHSRRRIRQLKWADIPSGKLHECQDVPSLSAPCYHPSHHIKEERCWGSDSSVAMILSRSERLLKLQPRYIDKVPAELPSGDFVCTDVRTVVACILLTVEERKSPTWNSKYLTYGGTRLEHEISKGHTFCHFQGSFQPRRSGLTKHEVEYLLAGYPPWYRETFITRSRMNLPFPINDERDLPRGGWIVAVGLMDCNIQSQHPLAVYRCRGEPDQPGFRENGRMFREAVKRCEEHIREHILPHFPNDRNVLAAITMLDYLVTKKTGSGIPSPGDFKETFSGKPVPHLRGSECRFVMDNFNSYKDLSNADVTRYQGILLPAMAATIHGAYEVVQYLKDIGVELKLPSELANLDKQVFLRDCATVIPGA